MFTLASKRFPNLDRLKLKIAKIEGIDNKIGNMNGINTGDWKVGLDFNTSFLFLGNDIKLLAGFNFINKLNAGGSSSSKLKSIGMNGLNKLSGLNGLNGLNGVNGLDGIKKRLGMKPLDNIDISFRAKFIDSDGLTLKLGPINAPLYIDSFVIDANISPNGNFGKLCIGGSFPFGINGTRCILATQLNHNPKHDAFMAFIDGSITLGDVLFFGAKMVGFKFNNDLKPKIPLFDEIRIENVQLVYAPDGLAVETMAMADSSLEAKEADADGAEQDFNFDFPPGFSFGCDVIIKRFANNKIHADMVVSQRIFKLDLTLDNAFTIGNVITVSGRNDENGARFGMFMDENESYIDIDCKIKFLDLWVDTLIKIYPSNQLLFDFKYGIFGVATDFYVKATKTDDNDDNYNDVAMWFEFGDEQKAQARQHTINLVLEKTSNLQQNADDIKKQNDKIIVLYNKGLKQLESNVFDAQNLLNDYINTLNEQIGQAASDWNKIMDDVKSDIGKVDEQLKNKLNQATSKVNTYFKDVKTQLKQAPTKVRDKKQASLKNIKNMKNELKNQQPMSPRVAAQKAIQGAMKPKQINMDKIKGIASPRMKKHLNKINRFTQSGNTNVNANGDANVNVNANVNENEKVNLKLQAQQHVKSIVQLAKVSIESITLKKCQLEYEQAKKIADKCKQTETTDDMITHASNDGLDSVRSDIMNDIKLLTTNGKWSKFANEIGNRVTKLIKLIENVSIPQEKMHSRKPLSLTKEMVQKIDSVAYYISTLGNSKETERIQSLFKNIKKVNRQVVTWEEMLNKSNKVLTNLIERVQKNLTLENGPYKISDEDIVSIEKNGVKNINLTSDAADPFRFRLRALGDIEEFINSCEPLLQHAQKLIEQFSSQVKQLDSTVGEMQKIGDELSDIGKMLNRGNNEYPNISNNVLSFANKLKDHLLQDNSGIGGVGVLGTFAKRLKELTDGGGDKGGGSPKELCRKELTSMKSFMLEEGGLYFEIKDILLRIVHKFVFSSVTMNLCNLFDLSQDGGSDDNDGNNSFEFKEAQSIVDECKNALDEATKEMETIEAQCKEMEDSIAIENNINVDIDITSDDDKKSNDNCSVNNEKKNKDNNSDNDNKNENNKRDKLLKNKISKMQKQMENSINKMNKLNSIVHIKDSQSVLKSPAGIYLKNCQNALDKWKTSKLAEMANKASLNVVQSGNLAKKACEIYKRIIVDNKLTFHQIKGMAKWENGDLMFDISIDFTFLLQVDLEWFKIDVNIDPPCLNVKVNLEHIDKIETKVFEHIWDVIKPKSS